MFFSYLLHRLVLLLLSPNCLVGDEFQSIYRFRHADVEVFRARRAGSNDVLPLTWNYRSRPELLTVVNELFSADFGDDFQPLQAAGRFPDPAVGPVVELLVTDKGSFRETGVHWRRGEAQAVAGHVRELVDIGAAEPGEIVVLFAAGTDAELFEEELRAVGLPTYRAAGRGYYGQQQVVDLLGYLRLIHNRYDDEALVTVLASPLVGVSNDALVLLRRSAGRRPLFCGLERAVPPGLSQRDQRLMRAFRQRYDRLTALSARVGLERLCEAVIAEHDYDLAVLAQWDGRRRYANLRKLGRLARSYEELRGPDIEGFVRFVRDQDAAGAREVEAFAEEEGADAVRLLTIHAAKGLEFKVVVVADAGRDRLPPRGEEILCLPDGRFGFKVADPLTGRRRGAFDYEAVRRAEEAAEEAERRRLYYVAMTRAMDRLIVSGSFEPGKAADARTPIGWVLERLGDVDLAALEGDAVELERGEARLLLRVNRAPALKPEAEAPPVEEPDAQLALFSPDDPLPARAAPVLPPLEAIPEPPLHDPRRLSFSALATFDQCSYKYFARYVAGLRERDGGGGGGGVQGLVRSGSAPRCMLRSRASTSPPRPSRETLPSASRTPAPTRSPSSSRSWRRTADRSSPRASRASTGSGSSSRSPSSTTASSCTATSTSSGWRRGRRSSSTTRRTPSRAPSRPASWTPSTGCSAWSTPWPACVPVPSGSRSSTTSSSVPTSQSRRSSRARTSNGSKPSSRPRSPAFARGGSCRRRATSPARAALRSTSCAPARVFAEPDALRGSPGTIARMRKRVVVYVTRPGEGSPELLVFEHRHELDAGLQVPAGGLEVGETIEEGAVREVVEETGLSCIRVIRLLGTQECIAEDGSGVFSTFVWATSPAGGRDSWEHEVAGDGEDAGMVFSCRFEPLPLGTALAAGEGEFLDAIGA